MKTAMQNAKEERERDKPWEIFGVRIFKQHSLPDLRWLRNKNYTHLKEKSNQNTLDQEPPPKKTLFFYLSGISYVT